MGTEVLSCSDMGCHPCQDLDENAHGIILFYEFVDHLDVDEVVNQLESLCEEHSLCGRIRVSEEGVNGNLSGTWHACQRFVDKVRERVQELSGTDFKLAACSADHVFRGLKVWKSDEVCGLFAERAQEERTTASRQLAAAQRGTHLTPAEFHGMLEAGGDDLVLFDVRNRYETRIGRFACRNETGEKSVELIDPNTRFYSEMTSYLESEENLGRFRGRRVLMYCTGGVRCERASALLKQNLHEDAQVFQLAGGIQRYMEAFPEGGFFEGSMHVFDRRGCVSASEAAATPVDLAHAVSPKVIGRCLLCSDPWERYQGKWRCQKCSLLVLVCSTCQGRNGATRHSLTCELCDKSRGEAEVDTMPERLRTPTLLSNAAAVVVPKRLPSFSERAICIATCYQKVVAREALEELLKWLGNRQLRSEVSSSSQALQGIHMIFRAALDRTPQDEDVVVLCATAAEHLIRDQQHRMAVFRCVKPLDMAEQLLEEHALGAPPSIDGATVALQILWRLAEIAEARRAIAADAHNWRQRLLRTLEVHTANSAVMREGCNAIRAVAEHADLRPIVIGDDSCIAMATGVVSAMEIMGSQKAGEAPCRRTLCATGRVASSLGVASLAALQAIAECSKGSPALGSLNGRAGEALSSMLGSTHCKLSNAVRSRGEVLLRRIQDGSADQLNSL